MAPITDLMETWDDDYETPCITVDCLLPTGIIVQLDVDREATIADIKVDLWKEAQTYPLYSALRDKNSYNFLCITQNAEKIELVDESRYLWDVKPFQPILKVVDKKGNEGEKMLNSQIRNLLGKEAGEFDNMKSPEVSDFRQKMRKACEMIAKQRDSQDWLSRAISLFPPDVAESARLPPHLSKQLQGQTLQLHVRMAAPLSIAQVNQYRSDTQYTVQAGSDWTPDALIYEVIEKHTRKMGANLEAAGNYALKVCGKEEYLMGNYPLSQFKYIRKTVAKGKHPKLALVGKDVVLADAPPTIPPKPGKAGNGGAPERESLTPSMSKKFRSTCSWDLEEKFSLHVQGVTRVNVHYEDFTRFQLRACLYHGPEPLTDVLITNEVLSNEGCVLWDETLTFDISLQNIPRGGRR